VIPSAVILPTALHRAIEAAAKAAYPHEACGLLLGRRGEGGLLTIEDWRPATNIHPEPTRHFELDPAIHFAVLREMRGRNDGLEVMGHVHSHPQGRAEPSARDLEMAWDPAMLWLILAVGADGAGALTAWKPENGQFHEVVIKNEAE